jgi:hypothetical protein
MTLNKYTNPPAFPRPVSKAGRDDRTDDHNTRFAEPQDGMTLRDYFAAHALSSHPTHLMATAETRATWAYQIADTMLTERNK